jgi:hypothetical protein
LAAGRNSQDLSPCRTVPAIHPPVRYTLDDPIDLTTDEVYAAVREFHGEMRAASLNLLLAKLGRGNKQTMIERRDETYARLRGEGLPTDPTDALLGAARPLISKFLDAARLQTQRKSARHIELLTAQIQALNVDVANHVGNEERALTAETRLHELSQSYKELNDAFRQLASNLTPTKKADPKPSLPEIGGALQAIDHLPPMPTHEEIRRAAELGRTLPTAIRSHPQRLSSQHFDVVLPLSNGRPLKQTEKRP